MDEYQYGDISGYVPPKLDALELARYRTGKYPANPAGALALVKLIDSLRKQIRTLEEENKKFKELPKWLMK